MPPKAAKKDTKKIVDDKTFGMKNKNKSSKVQKYIQQMQTAAEQQSGKQRRLQEQKPSKKELEQKKREELAEIFKPVITAQQKIPFGVDPKTILCQYFKAGACSKGKNCKFSHDAAVERKASKIDIYTDKRDLSGSSSSAVASEKDKENDTMESWDQDKLEQVVSTKHGKGGVQPTTDIVCKYFLQAVEDRKYGWFWNCPNGESCKYRHALPPGFVLKEQQKKKSDEPVQTLEEWIEEARKHLPEKTTPVTLDSFNQWKKDRVAKEKLEAEENAKQREAAVKAGRAIGASGKELFTYNPELFNTGEDEEAWEGDYQHREEIDGEAEDGGESIDESLFAEENFDDLDINDDEEGDDDVGNKPN